MAEPVVRGERETIAALRAFPEKIQRRGLIRVLRAGGFVVRDRARTKIRPVSGRLARSLRVTVKRYRNGLMVARIIAGRRVKKDDPFYALFVERGTKPHEIRPAGRKSLFLAGVFAEVVKHPGAKPQPYLLPALEEGADQALEAMRAELASVLEAARSVDAL